jgi:hypothetical protein
MEKIAKPKVSMFGNQVDIFDKKNEGETRTGKGGTLTLHNHRWHLDDEIKEEDRKAKETQPAEHSTDPNQTGMSFPTEKQELEPPLAKVKETLDEVGVDQQAQKRKAWSDLADYYVREAQSQRDAYLNDINAVAVENGLKAVSGDCRVHAVKTKESLMQKIEKNDKQGHPEKNDKLTDVLRTTLVIKSPKQFQMILDSAVQKGYSIYQNDVVNLYTEKRSGYKHIAIKLVKGESDPLVKELLLIQKNMLEAKHNLGHDLYDIEKNIDTAFPDIERDEELKPVVDNYKKAILAFSQQYYKKAFYKDAEESKGFDQEADSDSFNLDTINNKPPEEKVVKSPSKSKSTPSFENKVVTELRSFLKDNWQPISAKLRYSSGDMLATGAKRSIADLISDSIIDPSLNVFHKHTSGQNSLFKSLLSSSPNIVNINSRFNKLRNYTLLK